MAEGARWTHVHGGATGEGVGKHQGELEFFCALQRRFLEVDHLEMSLCRAGQASECRSGKGLEQ